MAERPVLFSAPMVRALLAGTKTQTRRVFKLPTKGIYERKDMGGWEPTINGGGGTFTIGRDGTRTPAPEKVGIWHQTTGRCLNAPFQGGDRLWVRETWTARMVHGWTIADARSRMYREEICYRADAERSIDGWWPSIFMPREFSRLTLVASEVRVQRLQEISTDDCLAEGIDANDAGLVPVEGGPAMTARAAFRALWDSLNAERGYAWDTNPWVVAVTFEVHRCNIDQIAGQA